MQVSLSTCSPNAYSLATCFCRQPPNAAGLELDRKRRPSSPSMQFLFSLLDSKAYRIMNNGLPRLRCPWWDVRQQRPSLRPYYFVIRNFAVLYYCTPVNTAEPSSVTAPAPDPVEPRPGPALFVPTLPSLPPTQVP